MRLLLIFTLILGSTLCALDTNQLIDTVRDKLGGVGALKSLNALELKGTVSVCRLSGSDDMTWSASGYFTDAVDMGTLKTRMGIDKNGAWTMDMNGGVTEIGGDQVINLRIMQLTTGWFCFRPDSGTKWEYIGDTAEGDHRLQMTLPIGAGVSAELTVDSKTALPKQLIVKNGTENRTISYSDYRKVTGVMLPFHTEETGGGNTTISDETVITRLDSVDEKSFARPESREFYTMEGDKAVWNVTSFSKYLFIEGKVNGDGPYVFFVDTGASNSVVDSVLAEKLGIKKSGGMSGQAVGGNVDVDFATIDKMELPGITLTGQVVALIPLQEAVGKYMPQFKIGGIIGYDVLGRFIIQMDYVNSILTLHRPKAFIPSIEMKFIPMETSDGIVSIKGTVEGKEVNMMLDTGSSSNIHFTTEYVKREKLLENRKTAMSWWGGAAGLEEGRVGRIKSLEIAGFTMDNLVAEFAQSETGALGATGYDANLGAGVLSRFDVVFDYPGHWLGLKPSARFTEQEEPDRMGILVMPQKGSIKIIKIDPEGSAAKSGILVGDEIIKVDQTIITEQSFMDLRNMFRQPAGTILKLTVKRNQKDIEIPVTLIDRF
jgi:predicted aspartyl protease